MKALLFHPEAVRAYAQERTRRATLRAVAEEVGIGASTLHNFLQGTTPQPRIRLKLAEWYEGRVTDSGEAAARDAIAVLLADFPAEHHVAGVQALLDGVAELFRSVGAEPPPWAGNKQV